MLQSKQFTCHSGLFQAFEINDIVITMFRVILSAISAVSILALAILLNVTSPTTIGPFGILTVFVFIYLSSLGVVTFFILWVSRILALLSRVFVFRKPLQPMSFKHSYYFASVFSAAPVIIVGLESVGAVGGGELLLVMIFLFVGCLYVSRRIY